MTEETYEKEYEQFIENKNPGIKQGFASLSNKAIIVLAGMVMLIIYFANRNNPSLDYTKNFMYIVVGAILLMIIRGSIEQQTGFISERQARIKLLSDIAFYQKNPSKLFDIGEGEYTAGIFRPEYNIYNGEQTGWVFEVKRKRGHRINFYSALIDGDGRFVAFKEGYNPEPQRIKYLLPKDLEEYKKLVGKS